MGNDLAEKFGFIRVASVTPNVRPGDPVFNTDEIRDMLFKAYSSGAGIVVFPELSVTGYTCQDLFYHSALTDTAHSCYAKLLVETSEIPVVFAVGMPLITSDRMFNCAFIACKGETLAVIPKTYIPNKREFYEKRWFSSAYDTQSDTVEFNGHTIPFGKVMVEFPESGIVLGTEICEDLWAVSPPSADLASAGANVIINLSASDEMVAKASYRRDLIIQQSARCLCAYVYSSAGVNESTTDLVFSGDSMIAENGVLLSRSERFSRAGSSALADIDITKLRHDRITSTNYSCGPSVSGKDKPISVKCHYILNRPDLAENLIRPLSPYPFIPASEDLRNSSCEDIFNIQVSGLAKRLEHTGIRNVFIGVSGGLDSTLALLVAHRTFNLIDLPLEGIWGVTMPGFGTSERTFGNAVSLMKELGVRSTQIDIREACMQHFRDISHDPEVTDTTYENAQARERTQILMDLANKHNGIVIGTGDLSEAALGWCTYNGDHMSMYAVNIGIPKTLVKYLIEWVALNQENPGAAAILSDILSTPISPELLPSADPGVFSQKTEDIIGPYELHDFFLYYFLRQGISPDKLLFLACRAFSGKYDEASINKWLKLFIRRFFSQQFKRSCMPDGPKVGSVALSPRGDWRMSSDTDASLWLSNR